MAVLLSLSPKLHLLFDSDRLIIVIQYCVALHCVHRKCSCLVFIYLFINLLIDLLIYLFKLHIIVLERALLAI